MILPFAKRRPSFRANLRQMATFFCHQCKFEWDSPWPLDRTAEGGPACPRCHSVRLGLKDGSVRREDAPARP